jgi:hypothetical protein
MPTELDEIVLDAAGPKALGAWWAELLGWDVAQGEVTWTVLADPEGTAFCVLRAPSPTGSDPSAS